MHPYKLSVFCSLDFILLLRFQILFNLPRVCSVSQDLGNIVPCSFAPTYVPPRTSEVKFYFSDSSPLPLSLRENHNHEAMRTHVMHKCLNSCCQPLTNQSTHSQLINLTQLQLKIEHACGKAEYILSSFYVCYCCLLSTVQ